MSNSLQTYLHDHLAGAAFAIDLLGALCRKHEGAHFAEQLRWLLREIESDRAELEAVAERLGVEPGGIKESVARFMEKLSRPKLISDANDVFSSFEACETLALGILGKASLWDALAIALGAEKTGSDLKRLEQRALEQHAIVEKIRLGLAVAALGATRIGR